MKKLALLTLLFVFAAPGKNFAQDTLPKFSLINAGNNRIIIGWVNKFENVKQISIQRSYDSTTGYKSILTVADPSSPQNGFLDAKAPNDHMFYRIYIMLDKGMYLFSAAKRPVKDTLRIARTLPVDGGKMVPVDGIDNRPAVLDSAEKARPFVIQLDGFPGTDPVVVPNPVVTKNKTNSFVPSLYVYTCRDGYVCIRLPDDEKPKKYSIKFYEEEVLLFELKEIKEREFKIDKSNFYHAGWFRFELYEDDKLIEKHKFQLEKDF
jgi:hypothetical protein